MQKRTTRTEWWLSAILAAVVVGGVGAGIQHTYSFDLVHFDDNMGWEFGYSTLGANGEEHCVELGRFSVVWWHRY